MGQALGFNNNSIKICTGCHEEKQPDDSYCGKCIISGLIYFGLAFLFAILAGVAVELQLSNDWITLLVFLGIISFSCSVQYFKSKITRGTIKGKHVEFYK